MENQHQASEDNVDSPKSAASRLTTNKSHLDNGDELYSEENVEEGT